MNKHSDDSYHSDENYDGDDYIQENKKKPNNEKKQKPIKKQKSKKVESKKRKNEKKQSQKQQVYEQDNNSFQLSQWQEQKQQNNHPEQNNTNNRQSQSLMDSQDQNYQNEDQIQDIRMILVEFFNSINQPNGLVFKKDFRTKLRRLHPSYNFTQQHDLDPQGQQIPKIRKQVLQLILFSKKYHNLQMNDQQFTNYIQEDINRVINIFKEASYIFCKQVTAELYNILRKICNIVLEYRNREDPQRPEKSQKMKQKLREFGNKIASYEDNNHKYFFFGYQFIKFPQNKTEAELLQLEKKQKFKFALKNKYRKPNTQYAKFVQKAGVHLLGLLTELKTYETLI